MHSNMDKQTTHTPPLPPEKKNIFQNPRSEPSSKTFEGIDSAPTRKKQSHTYFPKTRIKK